MKFFSISRIFGTAKAHRVMSALALALLICGGYWLYGSLVSGENETRYVLGEASRGTIVASVSASGQVAASDETVVKAKVSGEIVSVSAKAGQRVSRGQVLAHVESSAAERAVRDALLAVEEARLSLERSTLKAPIDYKRLQEDVARAKRDLEDTYEDSYTALSDAFTKLPDIVAGADSILYDKDIEQNVQNVSAYENLFVSSDDDRRTVHSYAAAAEADYKAARNAYAKSAAAYKDLSRASGSEVLERALSDAQDMAALLAKAVVGELNLVDTVIGILERRDRTIDPDITTAQEDARSHVTSANSVLSSLTAAEKAIETAKDALTDAEHELELASVGNPTGDDPFDLKLLENALRQKEADLENAKAALADHAIRAPFSGILASFDVRRGDSVANGGSVGTLISDQKIAELSLNEVDVARVEIGDKATLTFDAVEDLTLTGRVAEISAVGTVSQGVVSYTVKIGFDAQDSRIKPGMTVNASIQTAVAQDVLAVPASAVKTQGGRSYVYTFDPPLGKAGGPEGVASSAAPQQIEVETGISDDTSIEVLSGLAEGQQIIVRVVSGTANTSANTPSNPRNFGGPPGAIIRF